MNSETDRNDGEANYAVLRERGSESYRKGDYSGAIEAYTHALGAPAVSDSSRAMLHSNRAAAYLMLRSFKSAIEDCDAAIKWAGDDTNIIVKALTRKSNALKHAGDINAAIDSLSRAREYESNGEALLKDLSALKSVKSRYDQITNTSSSIKKLHLIDGVIADLGCSFRELNLKRLNVLIDLRRLEEAHNLSNSLLRQSGSSDSELLFARANILYYRGDLENALKHLQQVMRSDPDNALYKSMLKRVRGVDELKRGGDDLYRKGLFAEALESWSSCINLDPSNGVVVAKVYFNRASALSKLRRHEEAVNDCTAALGFDGEYIKALIRRADSNHILGGEGRIQQAIDDYEAAIELVRDDDSTLKSLRRKLQEAKISLKRSKRKDLYSVLGIAKDADDEEIKKAYKRAALKFHPDKQAGKSDEEQEKATAMFKCVGEAYEVLSDPNKKRMYDEGVEVEDLERSDGCQANGGDGCHGYGHDPNVIFQMFMEQQRRGGYF